MNENEKNMTVYNTSVASMEENTVLLCIAMLLKILFGMEACVRQVLIVYYCLYPTLNGYEIIKRLLDDWSVYRIKLKNIDERCFLIIFNKEKVFLIDKDDGHIYYPDWKDCKAILPKEIGKYLVREHDDWVCNMSYKPEFKDKGWNLHFDEDGEHYSIVDKWCSYEDLQPYNPIYGSEVTSYDNK